MVGKEILQSSSKAVFLFQLEVKAQNTFLGGTEMLDVRNSDGRLVCQVDERTGDVEIKTKNCKTVIKHKPDSLPEIINTRT